MGCPDIRTAFFVLFEDEQMKRVAIQGFSGCFHEQAARQFYAETTGECPEIVECSTFEGLYTAMDEGRADAAIMAIENTVSGGLLPNFELLRKYDVKIRGEVFLRIKQNLMALPGQKIEDIKEVRTHYMAINQTRAFFSEYPHIRLVESELRAGIETYKQNFTRFLIFDDGIEVSREMIDKASICFTLPHTSGSLAHVLTVMSFYGMNLTRIQSLPIPGREWQYFFYVDIKFDNYERYQQALTAVRPLMEGLTILGEYHAAL